MLESLLQDARYVLDFYTFYFPGLYGHVTLLILITLYFHQRIIAVLPKLQFEPHDMNYRFVMVWLSRKKPEISNFSACAFYDPCPRILMGASFSNDTLEYKKDEIFHIPCHLTFFWQFGYLFFADCTHQDAIILRVLWYNNFPIRKLNKEICQDYIGHDFLAQFVNDSDQWIQQARPRRNYETYHYDELPALIASCKQFFASCQEYADKGLYWKKVILVDGDRGTGKSSLCEVLAAALDVSLYRPGAPSLLDKFFKTLMRKVEPKSIMEIAEFDTIRAAGEDKDDKIQVDTPHQGERLVTTQTLCSFLDGSETPPGLIIVLTTNHKKRINPTLLRPGRVDKEIRFEKGLKKSTISGILRNHHPVLYDASPPKISREKYTNKTPSDLNQYLDGKDYPTAVQGLETWLCDESKEEDIPECKTSNLLSWWT